MKELHKKIIIKKRNESVAKEGPGEGSPVGKEDTGHREEGGSGSDHVCTRRCF